MSPPLAWAHLLDAQVSAFVEGTLDEADAAALADHLDSCPRCAARVAAADPLRLALAGVPSPSAPPDLVAALLAEAATLDLSAPVVATAPATPSVVVPPLIAPTVAALRQGAAPEEATPLAPFAPAARRAAARPPVHLRQLWAPLSASAALGLAGLLALRSAGELDQLLHVVAVGGVAMWAIARAAAGSIGEPAWLMLVELPVVGGAAWWWLRGARGGGRLRRS